MVFWPNHSLLAWIERIWKSLEFGQFLTKVKGEILLIWRCRRMRHNYAYAPLRTFYAQCIFSYNLGPEETL
jgi:hypothetical protein